MPPATEASKFSATLMPLGQRRELLAVRAPASALLAVTTGLPAASAASTARLAGSPAPPITSTKTSIAGSRASATGSATQRTFLEVEVALLAARTRADRNDLDRPAAARDQLVAPLLQELHDGRADGAKPGKTDFQRLSHQRRQLQG